MLVQGANSGNKTLKPAPKPQGMLRSIEKDDKKKKIKNKVTAEVESPENNIPLHNNDEEIK
jgi:hypothetical protein